jgi:putative PIN family toxin of toxin-antitoxin system
MKPCQIVIDTNVIVSGLRSKRGAAYKLLTMLNDNRWQINISTALIMEYEEVLKREQINLGLSIQDIDDIIDAICHIANHKDIFYMWRPAAHDPDDDFLIDLAVAAESVFLITYNPKDFKNIEQFGIKAVCPKEFLQRMGVI